jgi:acid phosphatase (class A)
MINPPFRSPLKAVAVVLIAWCSAAAAQDAPKAASGYLPREMLPDSVLLLPPPPAVDSAVFANDQAVAQKTITLRDTPRWKLATSDADLTFPHAAETFSCELGALVTEQNTPALYRVLQRSAFDALQITTAAKNRYARQRPFVSDGAPICTPEARDDLAKSGSYPSGQTTIGWAWALVLAEIAPSHANAILERGMSIGESRVVCNVHWQSDVDAGRLTGAAIVARLHAEPEFRSDLDKARSELAGSHIKPGTGVCPADEAALRTQVTP